MQPRGKQGADPARAVLRPPPGAAALTGDHGLGLGVGYLAWRIGWSGEGASPVAFGMLLVTEIYGIWALGTLAWFSWSRLPAVRPATTFGRSVDVYVCTYDEPIEVVSATLAGCRALTYLHTTYLLDDGRRPEMEELARNALDAMVGYFDNARMALVQSPRLLQPRLGPALRRRPPRAVTSTASSAPARTATAPPTGAARRR